MWGSDRRRLSKRFKTLCAGCQERKARFRYRGEVRADPDHTLCFECFRGEINRSRARRLADAATPLRTRSPFGHQAAVSGRLLDQRQLAHRQRMLDHVQRLSAKAS